MKVITWIIVLNLIFFMFTIFVGVFSDEDCSGICRYLTLKPRLILENYYVWTLVTSMFMHGSFAHLFFNMFSLFFIGGFIERIIGSKRFLWFYLISGIFAGLFFAILSYWLGNSVLGGQIFGRPEIIAVGASGALFGLLGLAAVLTPRSKVYLIAGPLIAIIIQSIFQNFISSASILFFVNFIVGIYIFVSIFMIFSFNPKTRKIALPLEMPFWILPIVAIVPLIVIGFFVELPIGNMAHLGGLVAGLVYGTYLRKKYPRKIRLLGRFFK